MNEFIPCATLKEVDFNSPDTRVIAVNNRQVLVREVNGKLDLPLLHEIPKDVLAPERGVSLGILRGEECAGFLVDDFQLDGCSFIEMRTAFTRISAAGCFALCRAKSLIEWKNNHSFCGSCGNRLYPSDKDIAMKCPDCGAAYYPQLAPAVITAITNGDKILLAHNRRFAGNVHSLIAGFVEAGENIEQAIIREVFEETSLVVGNIRYAGSQSWPFPNSLMLGFTAEYVSGTLELADNELETAGWFTVDDLPELPEKGSIARAIIDDFCSEKKFFR